MINLIKGRLVLLAVGFAIIFVILSYLNNAHSENWPESMRFLKFSLYKIQLPAILVGVLISGNAHQPNVVATYISLFILYVLMFILLTTFFKFLSMQIKKGL